MIFCSKGSSIYHVQPKADSFRLSEEGKKDKESKEGKKDKFNQDQALSPMQKLQKALDKQDFVFKTKKGVILKL